MMLGIYPPSRKGGLLMTHLHPTKLTTMLQYFYITSGSLAAYNTVDESIVIIHSQLTVLKMVDTTFLSEEVPT
jgi:hypothetical protein